MRLRAGQVKKPLPLAVGLGVIATIFIATGEVLDGKREYPSFAGSLFSEGGTVLGAIAFPMIVSFVARRCYFWWGFVPAGIAINIAAFFGFLYTFYLYRATGPGLSLWSFTPNIPLLGLFIAAAVLLSSGPVSLIRYIIQRRRGLARVPVEAAPVESAGKEGAWPPPPAVK